jgi:hypothetical protein
MRMWSVAPQARPEGSQGQARSGPPLDPMKKKCRPNGPTESSGARVYRPSGARSLFLNDPGVARFALAPGSNEKKCRPNGPTESSGGRVYRPSGARSLFVNDPGAACSLRFALAPGYLLAAPAALPSTSALAAPAALQNPHNIREPSQHTHLTTHTLTTHTLTFLLNRTTLRPL